MITWLQRQHICRMWAVSLPKEPKLYNFCPLLGPIIREYIWRNREYIIFVRE